MSNCEVIEAQPRLLGMKLENPFPLGFGSLEYLPRVLYEIKALDKGKIVSGIGEASIDFPFSSYDAWDIYWALKTLRICGKDPMQREEILKDPEYRSREHEFFPAAFTALNMAVDDLYGKLTGQSVLDIYGQKRKGGRALTSISFQGDTTLLISEIEGKIKRGFVPKPKVGRGISEDLETISEVAEYCNGREVPFVLDFNAQYGAGDFEKLVKSLRFEGVSLDRLIFVEQPTREDQGIEALVAAKKILQNVGYFVPVMADESFVNLKNAKECANVGILLNFKIHKIGGIFVAREIEEAVEVTRGNMVGGTFPTAIARTYDQQAAAVLVSATEPGDGWEPSTDWFSGEKHLIRNEFVFDKERQEFVPQNGPGLGVEVDETKVRALEIEDPESEYRMIRKGKDGRHLRINIKGGASYAENYFKRTGRKADWNL